MQKRFAAAVKRLGANTFLRETTVLSLGTVLGQGIALGAMPFLTRLYTASDFGAFAIFAAISSIVATTITLRYETNILLPKKDIEARQLAAICFILSGLLAVLIMLGTLLLPDAIFTWLHIDAVDRWLPISSLAGLFIAIVATKTAWLNRLRAYRTISIARVTQSSAYVAVALSLGLFGFDSGLVLAQFASLVLTSLFLALRAPIQLPKIEASDLTNTARRYANSCKYLLPTALLDVATQQLPIFLVNSKYSLETGGQFSIAWRTLCIPITIFGAAVGQVFFRNFSEVWPNRPEACRLLLGTWKMLALAGSIPTIAIMLFGAPLFAMFFGMQWTTAGRMAEILAPMLFVIFVTSPTSCNAIVVQALPVCMKIDFVVAAYRIGCFLALSSNDVFLALRLWVCGEILFIVIRNYIVLRRMQ